MELDKKFWTNGCSMSTPPKVVNFLWRAALDILPTRARLGRQLVGMDSLCILCNLPETSVHLCHDCSVVQGVWNALGLSWICQIEGSSFKYWWMEIIERCSLTELSHIACLCYYIWDGRNRIVFERETFSQHRVVVRALDMVSCFNHTRSSSTKQLQDVMPMHVG